VAKPTLDETSNGPISGFQVGADYNSPDIPVKLVFTNKRILSLDRWHVDIEVPPELNDEVLRRVSREWPLDKVKNISIKHGHVMERKKYMIRIDTGFLGGIRFGIPESDFETVKAFLFTTPLAQEWKWNSARTTDSPPMGLTSPYHECRDPPPRSWRLTLR
jgi:hypothetical protein